jgi:hypothetical protein
MRRAISLAEAIVTEKTGFNIEFHPWTFFLDSSQGAWDDLLATLFPGVPREEQKRLQESLSEEHYYSLLRLMDAEAQAAFLLGVAVGKRDRSSTRQKNNR